MNEKQAGSGTRGMLVLALMMGVLVVSWLFWAVLPSLVGVREYPVGPVDEVFVALAGEGSPTRGAVAEPRTRRGAAISFVGSVVMNGGFVVRRKALEFGLADGRSVAVAIDQEGRFEFSVIDPGAALEVSVPFLEEHPVLRMDIAGAEPPTYDLGTIVLGKGMSGVIIETHGIRALAATEFWAGLWTLEKGRNVKLITSGKVEDPKDTEQVLLAVPPLAEYRAHMALSSLDAEYGEGGFEEPMLGFSKWRLHTFDLSGVAQIDPKLIELPLMALAGRTVILHQPGNKNVGKSWFRVCRSNAQGRIKIIDRFDGKNRFTAFLETSDYEKVRLLADGRSEVIDRDTRTLAPIHRIVGLVRLDAEGELEMAEHWALDCSPSAEGGVGFFMAGVQLLEERLLDDPGSEFAFRTPGGRRYPFTRADLLEIEPGLFGIPIVTKPATSRLVVTSMTAAPSDLELALMQAGSKDYAGIARRGTLSPTDGAYAWDLSGLEAGEYDLYWKWKREKGWIMRKAARAVITLREREALEVAVAPPEMRILNGFFQNWAAIPKADRPRGVRFGGRLSRVDEKGSFETALPLSLSLPMRGDARLGSRLGFSNGVVEVIEVGADDRLTVALKGDEIITVLVSVGGDRSSEELGVECWVQRRGVKAVLQSPWGAERPKLSPEGMTTIPTTRDQVVIGSIWKFVYGLGTPSVLGFFEIDPMKSSTVQVKLAGRLVRVEHAQPAEQDTTQITVIWRSPGGMTLRCPVRWLAGQDAPAFWCPNTDVDIEFERDGAVQEFLGFSGARIALAGW